MKTTNQQLLRICEKPSLRSWLLDSSYAVRFFYLAATRKLSSLKVNHQYIIQAIVSVLKAISAGLSALVNSANVNKQLYVAAAMILIMAPFSYAFPYLAFDKKTLDFTWYHVNYFYLFRALSPWLGWSFVFIGFFLAVSLINRLVAFLLCLPSLSVGIIQIYSIITCTSNAEWHQFPSKELIVAGILSTIMLIICIDFFAWRHYHKFHGNMCRLEGLTNIMKISESDRELLLSEIRKAKAFKF